MTFPNHVFKCYAPSSLKEFYTCDENVLYVISDTIKSSENKNTISALQCRVFTCSSLDTLFGWLGGQEHYMSYPRESLLWG